MKKPNKWLVVDLEINGKKKETKPVIYSSGKITEIEDKEIAANRQYFSSKN
jgi:hypothetical protein